MADKEFTDAVSGQPCALVIPVGGRVYPRPGEPKIGVAHPGCPAVADLALELDARSGARPAGGTGASPGRGRPT